MKCLNSPILQFLIKKLSQVVFVVFYKIKRPCFFEDNSNNLKQHFRLFRDAFLPPSAPFLVSFLLNKLKFWTFWGKFKGFV